MNYSLGKRHLMLANNTHLAVNRHVETQQNSFDRIWDGETYSFPEHLDEYSAISGDDLARIAAFEPADPNLKPIGEQHGIWSDVRRETEAVAA